MVKGTLLRDARKERGLTLQFVARQLDISASQISRRETGFTPLEKISVEALKAHAELLGLDFWRLFEISDTKKGIVVMGAVQAGNFVEAVEWPEEKQYLVNTPKMAEYQGMEHLALEVRGDSMNEVYPPNSVVICVRVVDLEREIRDGERVVVLSHQGALTEATVKELRTDAEGARWLWPRSTSPAHQSPVRVDSHDLEVMALVVGSYRPEG
jgi:SOS-response transcriptional repressor LexA